MVKVTIVDAVIYYTDLAGSPNTSAQRWPPLGSYAPQRFVDMTAAQFVRFKNAGRRHPTDTVKLIEGQSRLRPDRRDDELGKWDIGRYGDLRRHSGAWPRTNRDHCMANSSNQLGYRGGYRSRWPTRYTPYQVREHGLAITVSETHHRRHSWTFGGRTKQPSSRPAFTRAELGATRPEEALYDEFRAMLDGKASGRSRKQPGRSKLHLEMVGAYFYLYKRQKGDGVPATRRVDELLLDYLDRALQSGK